MFLILQIKKAKMRKVKSFPNSLKLASLGAGMWN